MLLAPGLLGVGVHAAAAGATSRGDVARSSAGTWQFGTPDVEPTIPNGVLNAISCVSTTCLAVGSYTNLEGDTVPLADRLTPSGPAQVPLDTKPSQLSFTDVSCSTSDLCLAIGADTTARMFAFGGSTSGLTAVPTPSPPPGVKDYTILAVDCWDGGCELVGYQRTGSRTVPFAMSWVGGAWQIQTVPDPSPSSDAIFMEAVDCADASTCVATGRDRVGNAIAEVLQAGVWSITPVPPVRTNLHSVSCVSPAWCMAVGGEYADTVAAAVWDGTTWSLVAGLPDLQELDSVACSAVNDCTVVARPRPARDADIDTSVLLRGSASGWAVEPAPQPSPYPLLADITCNAAACAAVGNYATPGLVGTNGLDSFAVVRASGVWSNLATTRLPGHYDSALEDVSCPKAARCMAVGWDFTPNGTVSYSQRYESGHWSYEPLPAPPGAAIGGVTCPTTRRCYAVGAAPSRDEETPVIFEWDSRRWRAVKLKLPAIRYGGLTSVACSSTKNCVAVGTALWKHAGSRPRQPLSLVMDGDRWKVVRPVTSNNESYVFHSISCMKASTTCLAVGDDSQGGRFTQLFNGVAWKSVHLALPGRFTKADLNDVSCTKRRCTAVGFAARGHRTRYLVSRYQNGRWMTSTYDIRNSPSRTASISCAKGCVVVNGQSAAHLKKRLSFETVPGVVRLHAVSCGSGRGCVAVGGTGDETGEGGKPVVVVRNGRV